MREHNFMLIGVAVAARGGFVLKKGPLAEVGSAIDEAAVIRLTVLSTAMAT